MVELVHVIRGVLHLVGVDPQPSVVLKMDIIQVLFRKQGVGVLETQDEHALVSLGKLVVEKYSLGVADMRIFAGLRGKASDHFLSWLYVEEGEDVFLLFLLLFEEFRGYLL